MEPLLQLQPVRMDASSSTSPSHSPLRCTGIASWRERHETTTLDRCPVGFGTGAETTYTGLVTVTATSPADVQGSPQAIDVVLRVVDAPIVDVYLPLASKNH